MMTTFPDPVSILLPIPLLQVVISNVSVLAELLQSINNARVVTEREQKKRGLKVKSNKRMHFGGHWKGRGEEEEKCWPTEITNHTLQNTSFLSGGSGA